MGDSDSRSHDEVVSFDPATGTLTWSNNLSIHDSPIQPSPFPTVPPMVPIHETVAIPPAPTIAGVEMSGWQRGVAIGIASAAASAVTGLVGYLVAKYPIIVTILAFFHVTPDSLPALASTATLGLVAGWLKRSPFDIGRMLPLKFARSQSKAVLPLPSTKEK